MAEESPLTTKTAQGVTAGKARREALPRKDLGRLGDRPADFDLVALLESQEALRVPELVPLRHQRMSVSEFTFLRGSAASMAYDLALTPSTGIDAQLCGDAHVANFGVFLSPERRLVFDVNDFDETLPGPFEWDVKRLMASAAVGLSSQGHPDTVIADVVKTASESYRTGMVDLASKGTLDVWYERLDIEANMDALKEVFKDEASSPIDEIVARARKSNSRRSFQKMTHFASGRLRFRPDPPVIVPLEDLLSQGEIEPSNFTGKQPMEVMESVLGEYALTLPSDRAHLLSTYELVDMARKVVGVGSVGTRCFVILLLGRDLDDPLILQVKEAMPSVLESHLGPAAQDNAGARVVAGQRLMQTTPDIFLGHMRANYTPTESHDFYFRQFHDGKASPNLDNLERTELFKRFTSVCAWTLARAHARSGDRAAIASYLGNSSAFDKAMVDFALAYVERNRQDYKTFMDAIASGRLSTMAAPKK